MEPFEVDDVAKAVQRSGEQLEGHHWIAHVCLVEHEGRQQRDAGHKSAQLDR